MTMQQNPGGNRVPHNGSESLLNKILIILLCVTIAAVVILGLLFVRRLSAPVTETPVTSGVTTDSLPITDAPDGATDVPAGTDPATTTLPITDAPATDSPSTEPPATDAPSTEPPPSGGSYTVFIPESPDAGADYLKNFVFLGDSTTYHMHHYSDLDDTQVWVPAGGTLEFSDMTNKSVALPVDGVHYADWTDVRISEVLSKVKPKVLVVTLGINFSAYYNSEDYGWTSAKKEEYFKLQVKNVYNMVKDNSPNTVLVFQSIYPVIDKALIDKGSPIRQAHVDERNKWLYEACEELGIPVLKTEDVLKDANGQLRSEFNSYHLDGIHLNPDAYRTILNYVRTHALPNLSNH